MLLWLNLLHALMKSLTFLGFLIKPQKEHNKRGFDLLLGKQTLETW